MSCVVSAGGEVRPAPIPDALRDATLAVLRSHWLRARVIRARAAFVMNEIEMIANGIRAGVIPLGDFLREMPDDPRDWMGDLLPFGWLEGEVLADDAGSFDVDETEVPEWLS